MKKLFNKNYIVMASLMVLMPLSAEAHLPSSADAQHFDAAISGQKMPFRRIRLPAVIPTMDLPSRRALSFLLYMLPVVGN